MTPYVTNVAYDQVGQDETISLEDLWSPTPPAPLPSGTRATKKELGQKTSLGEEAIDLLMRCPRDDKTRLYVNGMSGEPSLFWEL